MSVLIVDDNISLAKTISMILKQKRYDVFIANSGFEALELVGINQDIDVVLMDIKMPVMNGVETFKKMKKLLPKSSVIMMTAYAVEDLIAEAIQEGAYSVIYKPFDIAKTVELIENVKTEMIGALILIVDDDSGTLTSFKNILVNRGYHVVTSADGEDAIEQAKRNNFDVIFLDLKLPTLNGFETYLKIREVKPDAIGILITGHAKSMSAIVEQALLSSMYTCLEKPLVMSEVLTLIEKTMKLKSSGG
ncbi:MAG: response regulator [Candidatus Thorarchaeota archaeon]|nr:MAG: response regulator [Candidatus Thorarchaeota archaeon]